MCLFVLSFRFLISDFRALQGGDNGRLEKPVWGSFAPRAEFVRGFGKISRRNQSGLGIEGEEFFADFDNLVRFSRPTPFKLSPMEPECISLVPIYRRFYFDGQFSGKFEFGFRADPAQIAHIAELGTEIDLEFLAKQVLNREVKVSLQDGRRHEARLASISNSLLQSYILGSTKSSYLKEHPLSEDASEFVFVGDPFLFWRVPKGVKESKKKNRRSLPNQPLEYFSPGKINLAKSDASAQEFDLIFQFSDFGPEEETADERIFRLVYCQSRMMFTAYMFLVTRRLSRSKENRTILLNGLRAMSRRFKHDTTWKSDELNTANCAIAALEGFDIGILADELENALNRPWYIRFFPPVGRFLDSKLDKMIEASASTATGIALKGSLLFFWAAPNAQPDYTFEIGVAPENVNRCSSTQASKTFFSGKILHEASACSTPRPPEVGRRPAHQQQTSHPRHPL